MQLNIESFADVLIITTTKVLLDCVVAFFSFDFDLFVALRIDDMNYYYKISIYVFQRRTNILRGLRRNPL